MKEEKWKRHIENMSERERKQVGKREREIAIGIKRICTKRLENRYERER